VALGVHYLTYKSRTVDERWADERTADLRSKSYDAGHIDTIAREADGPPASKRKQSDELPGVSRRVPHRCR
jgi:hypothetical protein